MTLEQHQLSAEWPKMREVDFTALVNDIKANGQIDAGVLYEGKVLDGWHRYRACEVLGIEYRAAEFEGKDPRLFVISKNGKRRHETPAVLAVSAARCMEWKPLGGSNFHSQSAPGQTAPTSVREAAEAIGVGERTMARAKAAVQAGLGDDVKDGALSLKQAEHVAKLPPAKRKKAIEAIKEGRAPKAKPRVVAASPAVEKLYAEVKDKLAETVDELERADKQVREQQELIESLKKSDLAKEVTKWKTKVDQLNGRVQQMAKTEAEAKKTAQYQADLLAKIRKALKVEKNSEILPALK